MAKSSYRWRVISHSTTCVRIHPAESRIRKLAAESPSNYFAFDILYAKGKLVKDLPIERRREKLESFFASAGDHELLQLSPATTDRVLAGQWFNKFGSAGL